MQTFNCPIAVENKGLANYTGRKYTKGITPVSFEDLAKVSKNTAKALSVLYRVLTGQEPEPDMQAIAIGSQGGAFKKFYGPELVQKDGQLGVAFATVFCPLVVTKGQFSGQLPDDVVVKVNFQVTELNGFDELVFQVAIFLESTDTLLRFSLPIRWADYKADKPEVEAMQLAFERKPDTLIALLNEPYDGSGSFDGPTLKLGQLLSDEVYTVVGYRAVNTSNGGTYMLQIKGQLDADGQPTQSYLEVANVEDKGNEEPLVQAEVWANTNLKTFLGSSPQITPENPAELHVRSKRKSKSGNISVDAAMTYEGPDTEFTEDDLDFNF